METVKVTLTEFKEILQKIDGGRSQFVTLLASTPVRMNKKGNPLVGRDVRKVAQYTGIMNYNYSVSVNNQREREGYYNQPEEEGVSQSPTSFSGNETSKKFVAEKTYALKTNDPYNGTLTHHEKTFQEYFTFKMQDVKVRGYMIEGVKATDEEVTVIESFQVKSYPPVKQELENPVQHRNIKLENLLMVKMDGKIYEISK